MAYDPRQRRADVVHERDYQPLYAEKRCVNCNHWRGQHIFTGEHQQYPAGLSNDALMRCPDGTSGSMCFRSPVDVAHARDAGCHRHAKRAMACLFCGDDPCTHDCPDPWSFDPTPVINALGLHLSEDT